MFVRALIVVLVALNLGVAAWWLSRPEAAEAPPPVSTRGGVELELLPATTDAPRSAPALATAKPGHTPEQPAAPAAAAPAAPAPLACLRLGPFPDRAAAEVARAGLGTLLREAVLDEEAGAATGYRVLLPPAPDRAQAQATARRIAAAGFEDFIVLSKGEEANAIALGAYRNRDTAERRIASLRAAGFPAELRAQGGGASRWWLQGATGDPAQVRSTFPAARDIDCATIPGAALR
ncbi:SPOR domain-containing protein [Pseudoxanthomonas suwonensis]|uniref:SPOR domain-containing protein n=1 Tax=Pseudoxanthomonas suwonensis TaxID=314722 RepID=UPI00048E0733|nr:SPOR domain-containing protein [Pseudoxanthomonas suwonensis]